MKKEDERIVHSMEENPEMLFEKGALEFLKNYIGLTSETERLLNEGLTEFAKSELGRPLDEEEKRFLMSELIYIVLNVRQ